jgi:glycosyltransferase involved in cell wall biosynthesis
LHTSFCHFPVPRFQDAICPLALVALLRALRAEPVAAFHAADTFVLPSLHEPFGIVVLEAWSAGRAVVASRAGGLKALVEEGRTGLTFDPAAADAAEALAAALARVADDAGLRARLGAAGREEARGRYDWPRIAAQLETIYRTAEEHAARKRGKGAR